MITLARGTFLTGFALTAAPPQGRPATGPAMRLILLIIVIVLLLGALPTWPYSAGWGFYPAGGLGTILIILLILSLLGVI